MEQQLVYVCEYYENGSHLNPVINKVKPNLLKRSNQPNTSNLLSNLSLLDEISQRKRRNHSPSNTKDEFNFVRLNSPGLSQELHRNKPFIDANFQPNQYSHIVQSERSFLMERNKELQNEVKTKDGKIYELGRKCDQLQMQLLAVQSNSFDNSLSNWSQHSNFQKSTRTSRVLDKNSKLQQLKSIRERLKKIDFSKFFKASDKLQERK